MYANITKVVQDHPKVLLVQSLYRAYELAAKCEVSNKPTLYIAAFEIWRHFAKFPKLWMTLHAYNLGNRKSYERKSHRALRLEA